MEYYNNQGRVVLGIVASAPSTSGRVKVRVPLFHGPKVVAGEHSDYPVEVVESATDESSLPWASVINPVGFTYGTGSSIPLSVGDMVYVMFTDYSMTSLVILGTTGMKAEGY